MYLLWVISGMTDLLTVQGIVPHFGKNVYSLSCWELDKKMDTTVVSVHPIWSSMQGGNLVLSENNLPEPPKCCIHTRSVNMARCGFTGGYVDYFLAQWLRGVLLSPWGCQAVRSRNSPAHNPHVNNNLLFLHFTFCTKQTMCNVLIRKIHRC